MMTDELTRTPIDITDLPATVRWRRALTALARVLTHPDDTEQVLVFINYANAGTSTARFERFFLEPRGRKLFDDQRAIDSHTVDLEMLYALPSRTLGHAYAAFMKRHGLTPNVFDGPPDDITDSRRSYVIQRMRQTHDLWHVVTNAETDPAGEVALQAFYWAQLGAPSSGIIAALGTLKTLRYERRIVRDVLAMIKLGRMADRMPTGCRPDADLQLGRSLGHAADRGPQDDEPAGGAAHDRRIHQGCVRICRGLSLCCGDDARRDHRSQRPPRK